MTYLLLVQWIALVPGLLAAAVGVGLAIALRQRSPRAATLLAVGLAVEAAAPLIVAGTQTFSLIWSPTLAGVFMTAVSLLGLLGAALAVAAAGVGRPARERDAEEE